VGSYQRESNGKAEELGVSEDIIGRILRASNIQIYKRLQTWYVSKAPLFVEKVRDVVTLYMDSPENSVVIVVDEKSSV
jgi:hypothetical protein